MPSRVYDLPMPGGDWRERYERSRRIAAATGMKGNNTPPGATHIALPTPQELLRWGQTISREVTLSGIQLYDCGQLVSARRDLPQSWNLFFIASLTAGDGIGTLSNVETRFTVNVSLGSGRQSFVSVVTMNAAPGSAVYEGFGTLTFIPSSELNIAAVATADHGPLPVSTGGLQVSAFAAPTMLG